MGRCQTVPCGVVGSAFGNSHGVIRYRTFDITDLVSQVSVFDVDVATPAVGILHRVLVCGESARYVAEQRPHIAVLLPEHRVLLRYPESFRDNGLCAPCVSVSGIDLRPEKNIFRVSGLQFQCAVGHPGGAPEVSCGIKRPGDVEQGLVVVGIGRPFVGDLFLLDDACFLRDLRDGLGILFQLGEYLLGRDLVPVRDKGMCQIVLYRLIFRILLQNPVACGYEFWVIAHGCQYAFLRKKQGNGRRVLGKLGIDERQCSAAVTEFHHAFRRIGYRKGVLGIYRGYVRTYADGLLVHASVHAYLFLDDIDVFVPDVHHDPHVDEIERLLVFPHACEYHPLLHKRECAVGLQLYRTVQRFDCTVKVALHLLDRGFGHPELRLVQVHQDRPVVGLLRRIQVPCGLVGHPLGVPDNRREGIGRRGGGK